MFAFVLAASGCVSPCSNGVDYAADAAFVAEYREAALDIARRKMNELEKAGCRTTKRTDLRTRITTGGSFSGYFLWDTAFAAIWASRLPIQSFPAAESLDNLYALADENGFINREYTENGVPVWNPSHPIAFAPPILTWAEMELFKSGRADVQRLKTVYAKLKRHHIFCRAHYRRADGLYFGDQLGCGMDDLRRWPNGWTAGQLMTSGGIPFTADSIGLESKHFMKEAWLSESLPARHWNRQMGWIDMTAQMALDAMMLCEMADKIDEVAEASAWRAEYAELGEIVNRLCWNDEMGFYGDYHEGEVLPRKCAAAFWVLLAKLAPHDRAVRMRNVMMDERFFFRPVPFPALSADDPRYAPETGYWEGPSWPPTTYVGIMGLRACGFNVEAEAAARRYYNANAALYEKYSTVFENISPEQTDVAKRRSASDFCGWGALAPVALPYDFGWVSDSVETNVVNAEAASFLPTGKRFRLVWHDEFNGSGLDLSKWSFRTNFWGQRAHWFAAPEDGCVEVKDGNVHLKIRKLANGQFVSPQLQTGELMWDIPWDVDRKGFFPLPKRMKPKFVHRYGYYECRFRLQRQNGWWSAFWMQTEQQGCSLNPEISGVEHDIMESFKPGEIIAHCFHANGYSKDYLGFKTPRVAEAMDRTAVLNVGTEEFHTVGMLWEPDGYSIFVDGHRHGQKVGLGEDEAVSHVPEFILLTTECKPYRDERMTKRPDENLFAVLDSAVRENDAFVVDYVRVFDICD